MVSRLPSPALRLCTEAVEEAADTLDIALQEVLAALAAVALVRLPTQRLELRALRTLAVAVAVGPEITAMAALAARVSSSFAI
jgi:hypothetical protein